MKAITLLLAVVCAAAGVFSAPVSEADYNPLEKRLISFAPGVNLWMTVDQLEEIDRLRHASHTLGVGYFDITDFQTPVTTPVKEKRFFPTVPSHQETVNPLLAQISTANLQNYITTLSSFQTRYYTTQSSLEASRYLYNLMQGFIAQSGRNDANCTLYVHSWVEPSVICRIEGDGDFQDEIVVTGAHVDSVNSRATPNGVSPGADDDASGVASFVEAFRVLVTSGFKPQRSLEFMAYAAEEVGLRGSQEIARAYRLNQKDVYAVYQNEMSGYHEGNPSIVILQDYVDATLTRFTEALVDEYLTIPYSRAYCGYGCSDHASWNQQTFATVCTAEAGPFGNVNPNMHTDKDTVDNLDFAFTTEFAKLGLAFLVELAQFS